jgi:hypothetical protein
MSNFYQVFNIQGRVIVMPRENYGKSQVLEKSTNTFVKNAIVWLAKKSEGFIVGTHEKQPVSNYTDQLKIVQPKDLNNEKNISVYYVNAHREFDDKDVEGIIEFVKNGGGLFAGGHTFAWNKDTEKNNYFTYPGNRYLTMILLPFLSL